MSSPAARQRWFERRTQILDAFCAKYDLRINLLNRGYQQRVENLVDFYPVNGRYCILQSGERGDWDTPKDIRRIMLKALPELDTTRGPRIEFNPKLFNGGLDFRPTKPSYWKRLTGWLRKYRGSK